MKNCFFKCMAYVDNFLTPLFRPLTKIAIFIILFIIFFVSCVAIIDRSSFHQNVINAAIDEAKKKGNAIEFDSTNLSTVSVITNKDSVPDKTDNKDYTPKNVNYITSEQKSSSLEELKDSLLDILSKSDGLLNSNALTFCVTLIVALLASLLLFRIEKMDKLVERNRHLVENYKTLKEETKSYYIHASKFNTILKLVESAYNTTIQIETTATTLKFQSRENEKEKISTNIASQRSRLSLLCREIEDRLNKRESRVEILSVDENNILKMYLDDIIGALNRCLKIATEVDVKDLVQILEKDIQTVEIVKDAIDSIDKTKD